MSKKTPDWSTEQSAEMYGIRDWGNGYFDVSSKGEVVINLKDGTKTKAVSLPDIVGGMRERGMQLPVLLRFGDLLRHQPQEDLAFLRVAVEPLAQTLRQRGVSV